MTNDELLRQLYDLTLVGNGPAGLIVLAYSEIGDRSLSSL